MWPVGTPTFVTLGPGSRVGPGADSATILLPICSGTAPFGTRNRVRSPSKSARICAELRSLSLETSSKPAQNELENTYVSINSSVTARNLCQLRYARSRTLLSHGRDWLLAKPRMYAYPPAGSGSGSGSGYPKQPDEFTVNPPMNSQNYPGPADVQGLSEVTNCLQIECELGTRTCRVAPDFRHFLSEIRSKYAPHTPEIRSKYAPTRSKYGQEPSAARPKGDSKTTRQ